MLFYGHCLISVPPHPARDLIGLGGVQGHPGDPTSWVTLGAASEPHRAAHHFGDMLSKTKSSSNHAVITAEEQHQTTQTHMKLETAAKGCYRVDSRF